MRSPFQRDRDRIIHSVAFRRLQYKTQVFVYHEGDHFRSRLTHSLEVSQIARSIARALNVDEDLTEAISLAHDLGHPPFGHTGEDALRDVMKGFGGFDHNEQSFRVLTRLENRYADFNGLNLSWEALEGVVKHNGPLIGKNSRGTLPQSSSILAYSQQQHDLELPRFSSVEAQVAAIADDIAYNNHDIDDGIRSGLITLNDIRDLPLIGDMVFEIEGRYPHISQSSLVHELVRRMITHMVADVITVSKENLADLGSVRAVRDHDRAVVTFSDDFKSCEKPLRAFLFKRLYRHEKLLIRRESVKQLVKRLFFHYSDHPQDLPLHRGGESHSHLSRQQLARDVTDYVAGMTDRYALAQYRQIFGNDLE